MLSDGARARVDVAMLNERVFLSHASTGIHPRLIREREEIGYDSRKQKTLAFIKAVWRVPINTAGRRLILDVDGRHIRRFSPLVIFAPGSFELSRGMVRRLSPANEGKLPVKVASLIDQQGLLLLGAKEFIGIRKQSEGLSHYVCNTRPAACDAGFLDGEVENTRLCPGSSHCLSTSCTHLIHKVYPPFSLPCG